MNALHLTLSTFDPNSGVVKKIKAQAKAIEKCGFESVYIGIVHDDQYLYINEDKFIKTERVSNLKGQSQFFKKIEEFIKDNDIKFIYYRFNSASEPSVIRFFHKLKKSGVRCVMEIPTYPYDGEIKHKNRITYLDVLTRRYLAKQFDYIVTFSSDKKIFGQKAINISNGIELSSIPVRFPIEHDDFIMLGVANLRYWHGFDRLIKGLKEYHSKSNSPNVKFYIVSGNENEDIKELKLLVDQLELKESVIFKGEVTGEPLNELFNICDVAIGSLGRHRNGIKSLKTLKNVEYAVRGVPFIYSENNPDFDEKPYVYRVTPDESPIEIESLINFVQSSKIEPKDIRKTVLSLSWNNQMEKVMNTLS